VAIATPNGHLVLYDCGRGEDSSPVVALAKKKWTGRNGFPLTKLIISHPHNDHIADIESITKLLRPSILLRRQDLDWKRVLSGAEPSQAMKHYWANYCPPQYTQPIPAGNYPDWGDGMSLTSYWLDVAALARVSASDNSYTNNSSIVTILKYRGYTFALLGDVEAEALEALTAATPNLHSQIAGSTAPDGTTTGGIDFLLTAHHGHPSGFSTHWFHLTGPTRIFNIVSERSCGNEEDPSRVAVDSRYCQEEYCLGRNRAERKVVSTRTDGNILVTIDNEGKWEWATS